MSNYGNKPKVRPANGPGSNGMRGGLRMYSNKTVTGPWLDDLGGPAGYKRGFTTGEFETEAQHAQRGALMEKTPEFGAGLPIPETVGRAPNSTADLFKGSAKPDFTTTNRLQQMAVELNEKTLPETPLTPKLPLEKIQEYRRKWTCDNEIGRKIRFQTESRLAGNQANKKFAIDSLRLLPGTPKALENLRERYIERYGALAFCALQHYIGKGVVHCNKLKFAIKEAGIDIKQYEFNQVVAFCTPHPEEVPTEVLYNSMKAKISGFDSAQVVAVFKRLSGGDSALSLSDLHAALNADVYQDLAEGIELFIDPYTEGSDSISQSEFVRLHEDMYCAKPQFFDDGLVLSLWL